MSVSEFYDTCNPKLVAEIPDHLLERMLAQIKPVYRVSVNGRHRFRIIETDGVDRNKIAYTWSPILGKPVKIYLGALNYKEIVSFHTWAYYGLFKPTLHETMAAINLFIPDWSAVRYVWLDTTEIDNRNIIGDFHSCRCFVFGEENIQVIDPEWEADVIAMTTKKEEIIATN